MKVKNTVSDNRWDVHWRWKHRKEGPDDAAANGSESLGWGLAQCLVRPSLLLDPDWNGSWVIVVSGLDAVSSDLKMAGTFVDEFFAFYTYYQ